LIQGFYHGITQLFCSYLDVAAGGTFFSPKVVEAKELIKKTVSNQGWSDERLQLKKRWMQTVNEVNMLSAKIVLLMNKIDERATFKKDHGAMCVEEMTIRAIIALRQGKMCTYSLSSITTINNGYQSQQQGWNLRSFYRGNGFNKNFNNQPSLEDLILG
jgi:hypothetical protein